MSTTQQTREDALATLKSAIISKCETAVRELNLAGAMCFAPPTETGEIKTLECVDYALMLIQNAKTAIGNVIRELNT